MRGGEVAPMSDDKYKNQSELRLEGPLAEECLKKYKVGQKVELTINAVVEEAVSKNKQPDYGPQHRMTFTVTEKGVEKEEAEEGEKEDNPGSHARARGRYKK